MMLRDYYFNTFCT